MTQSLLLTRTEVPTPIGRLLLVTDTQGAVRALDWTEFEARTLRLLGLHYRAGYELVACSGGQRGLATILEALRAYFAGDTRALEQLPVATGGTVFQRQVWAALREIPPGTTLSYGALATMLGRPAAVRAVGLANGQNPIGLIVPCHRVIGKDGTLTGYAGGLERKRWLLAHEGATLREVPALLPGLSPRTDAQAHPQGPAELP